MNVARGITATVLLGALGACAGQPPRDPAPSLQHGPFVSVLRPAGFGHMITRNGAEPIEGITVAIYNPTDPLRYDQGKLAKDVAVRACTERMLRFNPAAVGRYDAPNWIFPGACQTGGSS
ncbi:hypothetical protein [Falsirhodobacter algicola]|uniref:Uncharacterized protein n=1 Tax=Falsirhodobacter algicola TaxID=2692330 RepID=A0A8J8SKL0_9RHOB|nr:hypothetical protein [Falsirhodobacter algicola]QUS35517.1 hypothetical protein GR316_04060 [Falsirhodobacter algicola]